MAWRQRGQGFRSYGIDMIMSQYSDLSSNRIDSHHRLIQWQYHACHKDKPAVQAVHNLFVASGEVRVYLMVFPSESGRMIKFIFFETPLTVKVSDDSYLK